MLPPEKLPSWLLEKKTPVKVSNYSMQPLDKHTPLTNVYQSTIPTASQQAIIEPLAVPAVDEPTVKEAEQMNLGNHPEVKTITVNDDDNDQIANDAVTSMTDSQKAHVPDVMDDNFDPDADSVKEAVDELDAPEYETEPVPNWQAPAPPVIEPYISISTAPPASFEVEPTRTPVQQNYSPHSTRPTSTGFADWVLNNSRISLAILAGIILVSILLIILGIL